MADFNIRVRVDPAGAVSGSRKVKRELDLVDKAANLVKRNLLAAFGGAAIAAAVRSTVGTLASFGQEMSTVRAITGATDAQFRVLTSTARDLGATTRFSATEAAQGMLFLSRAGFDVNQTLESVDDTLRLAQAGALGLGEAADIASNVLTGFRLRTSEAGHVVDVLALAANSANTDVRQLGDALKFVAPVAAGLNVPIEETTAAVAALSNAGLQGSLAGTGLRRVLSELESPSTKTAAALKSLGLNTADVRVSQVGLTNAIAKLRDAGIDAGLALELFGDRGGPAFEVLRNSIPAVEAMSAKLAQADGTAARIAATMDDNLNGALLAVRSALEAVVLSLGELGGSQTLTRIFRGLATALRSVATNMEAVLGVARALTIAIGGALIPRALLALGSALSFVAARVAALGVVIAANPIGAIAVGLAVTISLIDSFGDQIKVTEDGVVSLRDVMVATFQLAQENVVPLIEAIGHFLNGAVITVTQSVTGVGLTFKEVLSGVAVFVNRTIGLLLGLVSATVSAFSDLRAAATAVLHLEVPRDIGSIGTRTKDAFLESFQRDFIGEAVAVVDPAFQAILTRARETAEARDAALQETLKTATTPEITPPAPADLAIGGGGVGIAGVLDTLRQEAELLQLGSAERERRQRLLQIEEDLGITLSAAQRERLDTQLLINQALSTEADLLDEIVGPRDRVIQQEEALNSLFEAGKITLDEYSAKLRELQLAQAELEGSLSGGLRAGLLEVAAETQTLGDQMQNLVTTGFDAATDSILRFVETGKFSIRDFVADVTKELGKLAIQQGVQGLFSSLAGGLGGGGGLGGLLGGGGTAAGAGGGGGGLGGLLSGLLGGILPGFANGGEFTVGGSGGTDSQLVAFRATPGESVSVGSPGRGDSGGPIMVQSPPVNVVNVTDPEEVLSAIDSPGGAQRILNVISKNPEAIRSLVRN